MPDDFYVECSLLGPTGQIHFAELACERTVAAYNALVKNLEKMYRVEDGSRIRIALRAAMPSDIGVVSDLLKGTDNLPLKAAWADASVRMASGTQKLQFGLEDCAPEEWVFAIESAGIGGARWKDASWGNNAAPSWELTDVNQVLAEAFFYTAQNTERHTKLFGEQPYVQVHLIGDEENWTSGFETSPDALLDIVDEAASHEMLPRDALGTAALRASKKALAFWH